MITPKKFNELSRKKEIKNRDNSEKEISIKNRWREE
jgi:hypothetical protein